MAASIKVARFALVWQDALLIIRTIVDTAKGANAMRKWWKNADPWTKWNVHVIFAGLISATPGFVASLLLDLIFVYWLHTSLAGNFDTIVLPGSFALIWLSSRPMVWAWVGRFWDLEYPTYFCPAEDCGRHSWPLLARELKNAPQPFMCPRCGRTLQIEREARRGRWTGAGFVRPGKWGPSRKA